MVQVWCQDQNSDTNLKKESLDVSQSIDLKGYVRVKCNGCRNELLVAFSWKRIIRRISHHLTRDGLLVEEADQPFLDLQTDNTLDQFGAASL